MVEVFVALLDERQEYHRHQAAAARQAGAAHGVKVEVGFADNNAVAQIQQVFQQVHAPADLRPAAIVVHSVTGEGLERVARAAVAAGIGWVILNRRVGYVESLRGARPDLPIAAVTPDQIEIGRIHARQTRALTPRGGLILYVQGPPDTSAATDRLEGLKDAIKDAYTLKVLNADWTEAGADRAVSAWLRLKTSEGRRPAIIVAQNDAMAVGAQRAAARHDGSWSSIPLVGCDALPDSGQRLVASGKMAASVVMPATAGTAVELVARWSRSGSPPPAAVVLPPASFPPEDELRLAR